MIYAYDIECFPNLFTATFVNVEDAFDIHTFVVGLGKNDRKELVKFLENNITLVGYNNHSYDDPMLRMLMQTSHGIEESLYTLSGRLISDFSRGDKDILALRYPRDIRYAWDSIDLMRILAFDKLGISLKQTGINLKWHKIQDMPVSPYQDITLEQLQTVLDYNLNDVLITKRLYQEITPLRKLREELSDIYGIDLRSASDSRMANLILENYYSTELKTDIKVIRDMRTERDKVLLGDCIASFISFKTPQLRELYDRIASTYVYSYNGFRYGEKVHFANNTFALGIGGLHSEDEAGKFESNEQYLIQDMDVSSYYPNLIINNKFYPKHLGSSFITVLKKITEERLSAKAVYTEYKKKHDEENPIAVSAKTKQEGLKITINSIFGKLGSPTFWLLDAKQMLSTTVSGQLGLLMLVEDLFLNGIHVISANTDGILCKIPRELLDKYYEIAHNWEKKSNLTLEYVPYTKYIRRDVNSYIAEKQEDGDTKEKGAFLKKVDLKKAYRMPIVAKALYAYFIKNVPVRKTLEECKDIMEFCISQKSASDFTIELHTTKGKEVLQKTNRFYITTKGGALIKRKDWSSKTTGLYVGRMVRILNDFDPTTPFNDYQVDLSFYEKEVMKIIDEIEPKQMGLFELSTLGSASIKKMEMPIPVRQQQPEISSAWYPTYNAKELNKLGKNQLILKLEEIYKEIGTVNDINPRYVYALGFNHKASSLTFYVLSKGITQTIEVDKAALKRCGEPKENMLIYCTKFENRNGTHYLIDYKITDKFEINNQKLI